MVYQSAQVPQDGKLSKVSKTSTHRIDHVTHCQREIISASSIVYLCTHYLIINSNSFIQYDSFMAVAF